MALGMQPPKFLHGSKEHTYTPAGAPDVFLAHLLKHILEESGGAFKVDLVKVQESISEGKKFNFTLWLPAAIDENGNIVWIEPGKAALKEQKPAALELVFVDEPAAEEGGPVLVTPGGAPPGAVQ